MADAILTTGAYLTLPDYPLREELRARILAAFLGGIERLAGRACRAAVAADGLRCLHRHFPASKIRLLEAHLMRTLRDDLYYWSYRVGAETLGLVDPFYIDHLIVFRIHYPFLVARSVGRVEAPPILWGERMRLAVAALRHWRKLGRRLATRRRRARERMQGGFDPLAYHGAVPAPARAHGPHIDTWYGHSYDGMNLWLSIDGVDEDNTVILYPDMFGRPPAFDPASMYIAPGADLSEPHKMNLAPGELLVFNPEMLHGTQVNISEHTRVALTTRLNPREPRFGPDAPFHMEHWYSSVDVRRRRFSAVQWFPAAEYQGAPSLAPRAPYANKTVRLKVDRRIDSGVPSAVCSAEVLRIGEKLAVDLLDAELLLWREGPDVRVFSRRCPHLGVDLADGYHDDSQLFCPGHGIAFAWADGRSKCEAFTLTRFSAFERNGMIYVDGSPGGATA